jgi:hypothetical protein
MGGLRVALGALLCCGAAGLECPVPSTGWTSDEGGEKASFNLVNAAGVPIQAKWFNFRGQEVEGSGHSLRIDAQAKITSYVGHSFRIYAQVQGKPLLKEYK